MRVPPFVDANLRGELRKLDQWARMMSTQNARTVTLPQGTPSGSVGSNLGDYLYLPGRPGGQISYGRVLFQAKALPSGLTSVPDTAQSGFGWQAVLARDGLTNLNIWIQSTNATNNPSASREWAFPAFNEVEGDTAGLHFFVDESNHQSVINKTYRSCRYVAGLTSGEGWLDNSESRYFQWSLENQPNNRNASTHANIGPRPIIQIGPLDVQTSIGVNALDNSHAMAVVKVARGSGSLSTTTPFEIDGVLHGGDTQREVYCAPGGAKAGYAGPSAGSFLVWNPAIAFTGTTNSNTNITGMSTTVGMVAGMRIRDTRPTTTHVEYFIVSVNSAFDITVSTAFSDTTVGVSFVAFGITYLTTAGIDHGSLGGLSDDDHLQYLNLNGRTGGQILSVTGGHSHSGQGTDDLAIHGQLLIDPNDQDYAVTAGRGLDIRLRPTSSALLGAASQMFYTVDQLTSGGTGSAVNMQVSGDYVGSTSLTLRGINFVATAGVASSKTLTEVTAAFFSNTPVYAAGSTLGRVAGIRLSVSAPTTAAVIANAVTGVECLLGPKGLSGNMIGFLVGEVSGGAASNATNFWGFLIGSTGGALTRFDSANVVDWTGLEIAAAPANPTGVIRGLKIGDIWSHHVGPFQFGSTAKAVHMNDFAAGTTGLAPIRFAAGTNLTAAAAGCVEYDGTDLMFTHGDAVRTKVVTQRGAVDAVGQTAAVGATTVYAAPGAGYYVLHYTLEMTAFTAGTIQMQVNYTDDIGATNQTGAAVAALGRDRGAFEVYVNGAQNIQYQTNAVGFTGTYTVRARLEYLG
jgi:hypothetical protein